MAYPYRQAGRCLAASLLLWASLSWAIPRREGWVTDEAKILRVEQRQALEGELRAFSERTGRGISVVLVASLGERSVEEVAREVALAWKIDSTEQGGVLLLLSTGERRSRIETAPRLTQLLTDAECADILERVLRPGMRSGDPARAITESVHSIQQELDPPLPAHNATIPRVVVAVLASLLGLTGVIFAGHRVLRRRSSREMDRLLRHADAEEIETALGGLPDPVELRQALAQDEPSAAEFQALQGYERALLAARNASDRLMESLDQGGPEGKSARDALARASEALLGFREFSARGRELRGSEVSGLLQRVRHEIAALDGLRGVFQSLLLPEERQRLEHARVLAERVARLDGPKDVRRALDDALSELQGLADLLGERQRFRAERGERVAALKDEVATLSPRVREASGALKNLARMFPGEGFGPPPASLIAEAQGLLAQLEGAPEPSSLGELRALMTGERRARQCVAAVRESCSKIADFIPAREKTAGLAARAYRQALKMRKVAQSSAYAHEGEQLLREAERWFVQGKKQLDLRERGNAAVAEDSLRRSLELLKASEPHRLGVKRSSGPSSPFQLPIPDPGAPLDPGDDEPDDLDAEVSEPYGWGSSEDSTPGDEGNAFGGASGDW